MNKLSILIILLMTMSSSSLMAQMNFSLDDSVKRSVYPSTDPVFYTWFVMTNHSGQDLNLRWVRSYDQPYPAAWSNNVQVLDSNYNAAVDSADFVLPAVAGFSDYILAFNFPNGTVDSAFIRITVYDPANPSERVSGVFEYVTYQIIGIEDVEYQDASRIYPNPSSSGIIQIQAEAKRYFSEVRCYTTQGQLVSSVFLDQTEFIDLSHMTTGTYILKFIDSANDSSVDQILILLGED